MKTTLRRASKSPFYAKNTGVGNAWGFANSVKNQHAVSLKPLADVIDGNPFA
jgi:hypothetical protein